MFYPYSLAIRQNFSAS